MDPGIREAYRICARIARARAANFYPAFLTLPPARRRALVAVYAYCRRLDDAVDDPPTAPDAGEDERRAVALREVERIERLVPPGDRTPLAGPPVAVSLPDVDRAIAVALRDAAARFAIPPRYLREIIAGVRMDLEIRRYPDFRALRRYAFRVASAVGLVALPIFGYRDRRARARAVELGLGMQLANIVRDVREDLERDRIYLPREDLVRFGVGEDDLAAAVRTGGIGEGPRAERLRTLIAFEAGRARAFLERGLRLLPFLPRASRPCPAALGRTYLAILSRIEAREYDVFAGRTRLGTRRKIAVVLGAALRALLLPARR
ncbi:MAG: phytoene/squalene synthase family protein [Planctomycetes bacterium]|nr:phytoene/squalene synthase family protein [Planctomycetota bacterium]